MNPPPRRKRLVEPPSPKGVIATQPDNGFLGGNNMLYLLIGAAGISLGVSVFMFREMRKLKLDVEHIQNNKKFKEQLETNTEAVKVIDTKINNLAQNMQSLHLYIKNTAAVKGKPPPPSPVPMPKQEQKPKLPQPETTTAEVVHGGPKDPPVAPPPPQIVKIETIEEEKEEECEDGVCKIPDTEIPRIEEIST